MTRKLLIVDDEQTARRYLGRFFQAKGFEIAQATNAAAGLDLFVKFGPDIVLLDLRLPDGDGTKLLPKMKMLDPNAAVVIITAHGDVDTAVRAMRAEADHFVLKPIELDTLHGIIERLLLRSAERQELEYLRGRVEAVRGEYQNALLPDSIVTQVELLARSDATTVLITGETGTGKGVLARVIHDNSARSDRGFVDINCATLDGPLLESELFGHERGSFTGAKEKKRGLIEMAAGGSLFLDEIGDMPIEVQGKLVKVIEENSFRRVGGVRSLHVDVRLMAATHVDLKAAVKAGSFREDLFYRLNVIPIELPPLRERPECIASLTRKFVHEFGTRGGKPKLTLSAEASELLLKYSWPGNIRELRNVIERAVLLCSSLEIGASDLPMNLHPAHGQPKLNLSANNSLATVECRHIQMVLKATKGNRSHAATSLGLHRSTLIAKIKKYGLQ